ncbi:MAG: NADH:flavin oxidoreductase/NADH oxidase [Acidobacteria bacterium]|nr:NADH:flavin oxidoreductase/NADH oxidase [Acidobacteriota bacterium]
MLFEPSQTRGVTLPNRIAVSPMCEYSSADGFATNWHLVHLGSRAVGGAGLVMTEATAVEPRGRISYGDLGIWSEQHVPKLREITSFIKEQGSVPAIQLAHAGRKASTHVPWDGGAVIPPDQPNGWQPVAPSPIPFRSGDPIPHELTAGEIGDITTAFVNAADRAIRASFEVIEIHAAHGYLLNSFLSPLSNHRSDEYGGTFENRTRLLREVIAAVRRVVAGPLWLRISASEWIEGGWTIDDSVTLAQSLDGIDLIDVSSGGNAIDQKIELAPGYQVPFAARIRREANIATGAVGLITTAEQAEAVLQNGEADVVLLAREMLRDPYFPMHAASALGVPVKAPPQYLRAFPGSIRR